jgi:hypothetical protein
MIHIPAVPDGGRVSATRLAPFARSPDRAGWCSPKPPTCPALFKEPRPHLTVGRGRERLPHSLSRGAPGRAGSSMVRAGRS